VAFAPTLYVEGVRIAVKASSGIASAAQLAGKAVAATTGTTSVQILRKLKREGAGEIAEVLAKDNSEGFLLLESGRVEGFAADGQILATLISKSREPAQYKLLDQVLSVEPIAIMLPKGDANPFDVERGRKRHVFLARRVVGCGAALDVDRSVLHQGNAVLRRDQLVLHADLLELQRLADVGDDTLADFDMKARVAARTERKGHGA
jgi:hypothetical protein